MKNNINFTILLILCSILLSSCASVQRAFDPQNKNTSDEFLVEKKSPLSMPPSFEELPVPSNQKISEENKTNNIKSLITDNKISDQNFPVALDFKRKVDDLNTNIYHHLGIYAYKPDVLKRIVKFKQTNNEIKNRLENILVTKPSKKVFHRL